jgi:hypothetical protein
MFQEGKVSLGRFLPRKVAEQLKQELAASVEKDKRTFGKFVYIVSGSVHGKAVSPVVVILGKQPKTIAEIDRRAQKFWVRRKLVGVESKIETWNEIMRSMRQRQTQPHGQTTT